MKRITLAAYLRNNLGDDLMVHLLLKRYPNYEFYFDRDQTGCDLFRKYHNFYTRKEVNERLRGFNRLVNILLCGWKKNYLINKTCQLKAKYSCCSVYIGGSLFMQSPQLTGRRGVEIITEKMPALPRFVIGANFGPYHTDDYRDAHEMFFKECAGVCFRDQKSHELFKQLPSVSHAPDVVFNLDTSTYNNQPTNDTVVISVINMRSREAIANDADSYEEFICNTCKYWIQNGKVPILMSFCAYEGDEDGIQQILMRFEPEILEKIRVYYYSGNVEEALSVFSKAEYVVATRFHAMILALRFGKPFFAVSYNQKVKQVLNDIGCNAYCELRDLNTLQVDTVFKQYSKAFDVKDYIRDAEKQFAYLDSYLKQ